MTTFRKWSMWGFLGVAVVATTFTAGYLCRFWQVPRTETATSPAIQEPDQAQHDDGVEEPEKAQIWTCSMHPQIRKTGPGPCPICGMDLIPLPAESDDTTARELRLGPAARKLAEIQVTPVARRLVTRDVRMIGKVDYDETRVESITAWVPGRIDRLFVDYTGIPVRKGDHMASLYSPDILTAQQELLQALKAVEELANSDVAIVKETAQATVVAVRDKLRLWGLTPEQVEAVEEQGNPSDHITIYAPAGGIVVHKNAVEGMYVQTGTKIYTIADLRHVWVRLNAYESDLAWLRYAQEVDFTTEAYPGETFTGRIAFINPVLDNATRTVSLRVNVPNQAGRLKPGMFVRATVHATLATGGKVVDSNLAGKWISPMHPEIVKDEPGACDVCGMPLVKAETLGFAPALAERAAPPLVIPDTAPLLTGRRAIVYVQNPTDPARFEGRSIKLGPRAGNHYIVIDGLAAGERVVTHGNFKIDSALQILAKPSMMSPEDEDPADATQPDGVHAERQAYAVPPAFTTELQEVLAAYYRVQSKLVESHHGDAQGAAKSLLAALAVVDMTQLESPAHMAWMKSLTELKKATGLVAASGSLATAREAFALLSEAAAATVQAFGADLTQPVFELHCPMAFDDRGANWLQSTDAVRNPYFGDAMLTCGEVTRNLTPEGAPEGDGNKGQPHD